MLSATLRRSPLSATWRQVAASQRCFAAKGAAPLGRKPKVEDGTLEGRYATALFMASSNNLDKVFGDLTSLRAMMKESKEFKVMVETPGIEPGSKTKAIEAICQKASIDASVLNFMKVLVENKRMNKLAKMIDMFETFYNAEKGNVICQVTSASELSASQKGEVKSAMQARVEKGSTLILEYAVNPSIVGGLVVKIGEAVYDNSVQTRLDRLTTRLLAPVE